MQLIVTVVLEGGDPPPPGATLRVEVRDVSFADAPAEILGTAVGEIGESAVGELTMGDQRVLGQLACDIDRRPDMGVVWVHVDVNGDGRVSVGDYITTQSWPVPPGGEGAMTVTVRRI